jgi:hypothetical protein
MDRQRTLPSHLPPTPTKQTTYSLSLTNSNNVLYWSRLIRAPGLSVPASLMRPRRAVLQTPPKSPAPPRLPFYKSCPPPTRSKSTLLQLLIPPHFNSPRINTYKKPGRGSLLPAPKFCNSSLLPYRLCSLATVPVTPFSATLAGHSQLTENPATLSPAFATLTRRVKHKSFVCHSYKKHRGWGMPFSSNLRTIETAEPAAIFLATRSHLINTSGGLPRKRVGAFRENFQRDVPSESLCGDSYEATRTGARSSSGDDSGATRARLG